ncbi:DUF4232 domain-containing protein [Streptomyces purpurogeneiscleroticus]|uniref:DUF4232 domain-containing protein n=1 Tax=Streptomyces purpurogeneiscleroticus TaxID=68259 RepID=UPI001CBBBB9A|nr:DUF4232 domain-containing protein [Streptomyces purpurogeneiscleroticus]MBZ4020427.1 hypothetical protein [Streptomyces purpurogeneiscleroticus]
MSHRTRRHSRKAAAAALLAATALALTACQSGESGAAGSDSSASAGSSAGSADGASKDSAAQTDTGSAEGSGTDASSGGQQATGSGGASGTDGTDSSAARCTTASMTAGWGSEGGGRPDMNSDQQETATVWFKNNGSAACTISGFPGVQLKGTDGTTWDLRRSGKKPVPVTLKPGANTHFTFQLLPSTRDDDRKLEPATVVVTPPNEKQHFELKWPYGGAILDQSGATRPGTFVNPVGAS